ncbi:MAG: DUF4388 domain-containing protein [Acidobacteria bacterium]|nr:DUF4388 domain-containing protein [Acidobacteriota bacterium]
MPTPANPTLLMSGRLEAIPLGDVLQVLAAAGRDGVLSIERDDPAEQAEIELAGGKIVRAEIQQVSERTGSMLLRRQALDPAALADALRVQSTAEAWWPLGDILLRLGAVDPPQLAQVLRTQIEQNVAVMLAWEQGVFRFRALPQGEGATAERELGVALDPRDLLLDAARMWDEVTGQH